MRGLFAKWLSEIISEYNAQLDPEISPVSLFAAGAVDEQPSKPFVTHRVRAAPKTVSGRRMPNVEIWVHDERGSYVRIDEILAFIDSRIDGKSYTHTDWPGELIAQCETGEILDDAVDDGFNTNTKSMGAILIGGKV